MESVNFEFLRIKWPHLADLGAFAERYCHDDPPSALVKLRAFTEQMLLWIFDAAKFQKPERATFFDLLDNEKFKKAVSPAVLNKFHQVRKIGNHAAHSSQSTKEEALFALQEAFDLGCWLFITAGVGTKSDCPSFSYPKQQAVVPVDQLTTKEAELEQAIVALTEERAKTQTAVLEAKTLEAAGNNAASELQFNESQTRKRLIDVQLADAGWKLDDPDEVTDEWEVKYQPTKTGLGRADYVLWDDNGQPLAVIEAKRTAEDPVKGKNQARLYADGLEKEYGQRPIIFYTNGFDTYIWDDHKKQKYPPRKVYGFYSKDSLQYLVQQRTLKLPLNTVELDMNIANRTYQLTAIRNAFDEFMDKRRKALFVLATGTGKTRVAVSLSEAMIRARWAKRILFLCDRLELRKQAKNAFREFVAEPMVEVKASTYKDRDKRVYFATYPAMMKAYNTFDVGFFDLIIADESHRSIYNIYRDIFKYFDSFQLGLTATPRDNINRNTFQLFGCDSMDPTAYYPYEQGVEDNYLVPFLVYSHTTKFLRDGIKYKDLSEEQIKQLEDGDIDPEDLDYDKSSVDKQIYNKDTNRHILRNLMENGIRDAVGQLPGKSIIFARNHKHALLLAELFDEMYPQYGGKFCQVIDNYDPRADQLIDDFKDPNNELTIAISVDMLDTGIDVPEVVNLSFAKPVKSFIKFWQMIGRGTRLCKDLFGPGLNKEVFRIFDHWDNFAFFEQQADEDDSGVSKSLMQLLFEERIGLAESALKKGELDVFETVVKLIQQDVADLPESSIAVKDKWKEKRTVESLPVLTEFSPATVQALRREIAPLMQWINLRGRVEAKAFDLLCARYQNALIVESSLKDDLRGKIQNQAALLPMHLNPVRVKSKAIKQVLSVSFWKNATFTEAEMVRTELRGIMQYKPKGGGGTSIDPPVIDVQDSDVQFGRRKTTLTSVEMEAFRRRVHSVLEPLFASNPTLKKIRASEPVDEAEIGSLISLVLTQHPDVDLAVLQEFYPASIQLEDILRSIIGMEIEVVQQRFADFTAKNHLNKMQGHFLLTLQRLISNNGALKVAQLYDAPFTSLHSDGVDGLFQDDQVDELLDILKTFDPATQEKTEQA